MRVLFFMKGPGHVRNYESTIRELAGRGHAIELAFSTIQPKRHEPSGLEQAEELAASCADVTWGLAPARDPADGWSGVATAVRLLGDLGRFAHPRYAQSPLLRERAQRRVQRAVRSGVRPRVLAKWVCGAVELATRRPSRLACRLLVGAARCGERAVPSSDRITTFVRDRRPDVVLATPVVEFGSDQVEYLKSAQQLSIPTGVCVASWDNLTNKGVLRIIPERLFVWNENQRSEAEQMHGVPGDRVVATGAPRFDQWFVQYASREPEPFRRAIGLPSSRPYVLYMCSSPFIAPDEVSFVRRWIESLRRSDDPRLRDVGVLVRPHPQNAAQWEDVDLDDPHGVVWPRGGAQVVGDAAKADFYDSIAHSSAVVGVNTSALIEASILAKPVLTVLSEFEATQLGTIHYHYLRRENGGFLCEARTLAEHLQQLVRALAKEDDGVDRARSFVSTFVRPSRSDVTATAALADGIEELATLPASDCGRKVGSTIASIVLTPVAVLCRRRGTSASPENVAARRSLRRRAAERAATRPAARRVARHLLATLQVGEVANAEAGPADGRAAVARRAEREARAVFESGADVIALGPWRGDVRTELLYWIPFLRWSRERFDVGPERLAARVAGGHERWYANIASHVQPVDDRSIPCFSPDVVEALVEAFRRGEVASRQVLDRLRFDRLTTWACAESVASTGVVLALAETPALPDTPETRAALAAILATVGSSGVVQNPLGWDIATGSDIVAGASRVVGAIDSDEVALGVCHGVPTLALYTAPEGVDPAQVRVLAHAARSLDSRFLLLHVSQVDLVALFAGVAGGRTPAGATS